MGRVLPDRRPRFSRSAQLRGRWTGLFRHSGLSAPRSEFALQRQPSVRQATLEALCATGRARTAADTNAVHDRLLQSMRVRFSDSEQWSSPVKPPSDSEQWSSPVKPPRSQNYVKPHDARTRVPSFERIRYRWHDASVFLFAFDLISSSS